MKKRIRYENGWIAPCPLPECDWESYPETVHMWSMTSLKRHVRDHELGIYPYEDQT